MIKRPCKCGHFFTYHTLAWVARLIYVCSECRKSKPIGSSHQIEWMDNLEYLEYKNEQQDTL